MLLPAFVASVSPVMVQEAHNQSRQQSIKITTYSVLDMLNRSDVPVYCKIQYRRKANKATRSKKTFVQCCCPDSTLHFPFLCQRQTKALIGRSKVLCIMRGLPGSGKSTVVKAITDAYPSSVVCSADDHFLQNGVYKFDAACLGSAHAACQHKAREACSKGAPVVVVDNTNVRRWEMKFYLELACHTDYVVVPVQPKTAWRWNPEELATRNKHGVDIDTLRRKVKQFDDVIPVFYAWFLPEPSSKQLTFIAQCLLQECVQQFPGFMERLLKQLHVSGDEYRLSQQLHGDSAAFAGLFKHYYTKGNKAGFMMHCTAKFCQTGRAVGAKTYHSLPVVQSSLGQSFMLQIHSVCFSPRSVGARVQLRDEELPLFDKPEERNWDGVQPCASPASGAGHSKAAAKGKDKSQGSRSSPSGQSKHSKKKAGRSKQESDSSFEENQSFPPRMKELQPKSTKPLSKVHGRSAHITIGCAHGVGSRETNFDVLRLCDMEAGSEAADADFVAVTGGRARYFRDGVCCVYFDPPLFVKTIYSGLY